MTTENKRDLAADLAICEAAAPAFTLHSAVYTGQTGGIAVVTEICRDDYEPLTASDMEFILEAREGWPEAIYRAMAAEERWAQLRAIVYTNATGGKGEDINEYDIIGNLMDEIAEDVFENE